jgi:hypothetical protein
MCACPRRARVSELDRVALARVCYGAFESGDRRVVENLLSDDFTSEVLTFDGDKIRRAEVYFGWDLE